MTEINVIFGAGRVGITNAINLSRYNGKDTIVIDTDEKLLRKLKAGIDPYEAPFFAEYLHAEDSRISFMSYNEFHEYIEESELNDSIGMICHNGGITYLFELIYAYNFKTWIIRSTLTPSDIEFMTNGFQNRQEEEIKLNLSNIWYVPEFLTEGQENLGYKRHTDIVSNFNSGSDITEIKQIMGLIHPMIMSPMDAAIVKLGTNIALAFKVTLANVLYENFSEYANLPFNVISRTIELDSRIGTGYLRPGIGYGGSCLPFAMSTLKDPLSKAVVEYNDELPIKTAVEGNFGPSVLVFGYNFKRVKDYRLSNQLKFIETLNNAGRIVYVSDDFYDPIVKEFWIDNPLDVLDEITDVVIFYETKSLEKIENYIAGIGYEHQDYRRWNKLKKIDFR